MPSELSDLNEVTRPLPAGPFQTLLADPPWPYRDKLTHASYGAAKHYPLLSVERIAAIPVTDVVADNAHLYLWCTNAFIEQAHGIARAWGFAPKTIITWVKSVRPDDDEVEEWKPCPGFERTHQVSSFGRVRTREPKRGGPKEDSEILAQRGTKDGYLRVTLSKDGGQFSKKVHQLVAAAFIGPKPDENADWVIDHIDDIAWNNYADNLQWLERGENVRKTARTGDVRYGRPGVRVQHGLGWYFRNCTEHVIFAVRGRMRTMDRLLPTVMFAQRTKHSRKPELLYEWIEKTSPEPRLEMFARAPRRGWTAWGNEIIEATRRQQEPQEDDERDGPSRSRFASEEGNQRSWLAADAIEETEAAYEGLPFSRTTRFEERD